MRWTIERAANGCPKSRHYKAKQTTQTIQAADAAQQHTKAVIA